MLFFTNEHLEILINLLIYSIIIVIEVDSNSPTPQTDSPPTPLLSWPELQSEFLPHSK